MRLAAQKGRKRGLCPRAPTRFLKKREKTALWLLEQHNGFLPASRSLGAARLVSFMGSACGGPQPLNTMGRRTAPGPAGGRRRFAGRGPAAPSPAKPKPRGPQAPGALWALRAPAAPPRVPALSAGAGVNPRGESVLTGGEKAPGLSRGRRRWPGSAGPGIGRCDSRRKPRGGSGWPGGW